MASDRLLADPVSQSVTKEVLGCMATDDAACQYVWADDDPEPSNLPIEECTSTDKCKAGETCCTYSFIGNTADTMAVTGLKVGCLSDSQVCMEEFAIEDIPEPSPPQPDEPTYPRCESKDDCMGLKQPEHDCCVIEDDFTKNGMNIMALTIGCLPVGSEQCVESFAMAPDPVTPDVPIYCEGAADCAAETPVCCVYKTSGSLSTANYEGLDLGCFASGDEQCMEVFEKVDPPGPEPVPVVAPACNKTADCEEADAKCCVYNYHWTHGGYDFKGMGVGCLNEYFQWECLEEFEVVDPPGPTPPEPHGPTEPPCTS